MWKNAVQFRKAKVEQYPLLANIVNDDYYFTFKIEDQHVAYLKATKIDDLQDRENVLMIKRSWIEPNFRNRGLMTALYNTLHNQGFVLLSDYQLSPESISIWKALGKRKPLKVINRDTQIISDLPTDFFKISDDSLLLLYEAPHKWHLNLDNFQMMEVQLFIDQSDFNGSCLP